jgi:cytochrome c
MPKYLATSTLALLLVAGCEDKKTDPVAIDAAVTWTTFAEQVTAGGQIYGQHCASCHGASGEGTDKAPRVVGLKDGALPLEPPPERKFRKTKFITVADVADFVAPNMPPGKGGSLAAEQYWAILAFDLKANGVELQSGLTPELAKTLTIPR